jgi:hypothetical protein
VREVFDIDAKDKAEMERSDWLKFDGSLFGGGGDTIKLVHLFELLLRRRCWLEG